MYRPKLNVQWVFFSRSILPRLLRRLVGDLYHIVISCGSSCLTRTVITSRLTLQRHESIPNTTTSQCWDGHSIANIIFILNSAHLPPPPFTIATGAKRQQIIIGVLRGEREKKGHIVCQQRRHSTTCSAVVCRSGGLFLLRIQIINNNHDGEWNLHDETRRLGYIGFMECGIGWSCIDNANPSYDGKTKNGSTSRIKIPSIIP